MRLCISSPCISCWHKGTLNNRPSSLLQSTVKNLSSDKARNETSRSALNSDIKGMPAVNVISQKPMKNKRRQDIFFSPRRTRREAKGPGKDDQFGVFTTTYVSSTTGVSAIELIYHPVCSSASFTVKFFVFFHNFLKNHT